MLSNPARRAIEVSFSLAALLALAPAASAYIGPGGPPSVSVAALATAALGALLLTLPLLGIAAALLGPAWLAWYARSLAPRRCARRVTVARGSTFPDLLADRGRRAKLA